MRLLLLLLLLAPAASANMANPVQPGTPAGEPSAALDGLRIAREALTLDLRPLGLARRYGVVEAEYRIVNRGEARTLPLDFLALGDDIDQPEVWLDEQPVTAQLVDSLAVPASWRSATQTPALDGDAAPYEADETLGTPTGLRFEVTIPPGQHSIRVAYRVLLGSYDSGEHPNRIWQLAYSLAPARLWAGFDVLEVAVLAPPDWEVATSLPLREEAGALTGRFRGVPGDILAVSVRAPAPVLTVPFRIAALVVPMVVLLFVGFLAGRVVARTERSHWAALPASLLAAVVATVARVALVATAADLGDSAAHSYGALMGGIFFAGPLTLAGGLAIAQAVAAWQVHVQRGRRAESAKAWDGRP